MSAIEQKKDQEPQSAQDETPIEPGHVMPRKQYEDLVRKAAGQK